MMNSSQKKSRETPHSAAQSQKCSTLRAAPAPQQRKSGAVQFPLHSFQSQAFPSHVSCIQLSLPCVRVSVSSSPFRMLDPLQVVRTAQSRKRGFSQEEREGALSKGLRVVSVSQSAGALFFQHTSHLLPRLPHV